MNPLKGGRIGVQKINENYSFTIDGKPFKVKGGSGFSYVKELAAAGGNTLKTWDTANLYNILNEAGKNNVYVIAGFYLPPSHFINEFYSDSAKTGLMLRSYLDVVKKYKNHPALLSWCVGNELEFSFHPSKAPFYKFLKQLVSNIRNEDADHPLTTTIMERMNILGIKTFIPEFDYLSINSFANLKQLKPKINALKWIWNGPYLITEWAPIGGWEAETTAWHAPIENTSTKTAEQVLEYYRNYMPVNDNRLLGSMVFFWGTKQEYTHTWFSMFDEEGHPYQAVESITAIFKNTTPSLLSPQVKFMLLNEKGARENILVKAGSQNIARLVPGQNADTSQWKYKWEILKEDWWGHLKSKPEKPPAENIPLHVIGGLAKFNAPLKAGPYRIFVTVTNENGYSATANTPFYVLD